MLTADEPRAAAILRHLGRTVPISPFGKPPYEDRDFLFLAMIPRSGSSYLGSLITANGYRMQGETFRVIKGNFEKYVRRTGVRSYEGYIRQKIEDSTANGLFGAKLGWPQFIPIYFSGAYAHYFQKAHFVYLTRESILDQAISLYVAHHTGYYHSIVTDKAANVEAEIPFDFDKIKGHVKQLVDMQGEWESFFAAEGIRPLRVTYEQLSEDPAAVLGRIGEHIGRPMTEGLVTETEFKKVATDKNARLREQYVAEQRARMAEAVLPATAER